MLLMGTTDRTAAQAVRHPLNPCCSVKPQMVNPQGAEENSSKCLHGDISTDRIRESCGGTGLCACVCVC
jgi:hypothetical protein